MARDNTISLDLNNPEFHDSLFALQKPERLAVLDTLKKIRQLTWQQLYSDKGLRWEKISSIKPPTGIAVIYSLRLNKSCRATAYRDGNLLRFLTIFSDHDATYGKK